MRLSYKRQVAGILLLDELDYPLRNPGNQES